MGEADMYEDLPLPVPRFAGLAPCDVSMRLVADAQAPGTARRLVRQLCGEAGVRESVSDMAVLLTSEAVTNSILHGRGQVRLHAVTAADRIRVEVADRSRRTPVLISGDVPGELGRGVQLLAQCASAWGVDVRPLGKTVWFEVAAE